MNKTEEQFVTELKLRGNALEKECKLLREKIRDLRGYLNVLETTALTDEEMDIITKMQAYLKGAKDE